MKAYRQRVRGNRALTDCKVYDASTVIIQDGRIVAGHVIRTIPKRKAGERNYTRKPSPKLSVDMLNALDSKRRTTAADLPSVYSPEDIG